MNSDSFEDFKKQIRQWIQLDYIVPEDIPDIELYMDQVTTFMDTKLSGNKRNPDDKTLTKTMINNYTKNDLLPPPNKKKYSKNHIILLIYIYYLKSFISIGDIQTLLSPMIEQYFDKDSNQPTSLFSVYEDFFELERQQGQQITQSLFESYKLVNSKFDAESDQYLHDLAYIIVLGYDIYSKKQLIERMIDQMQPPAKKEEAVAAAVKEKQKEKKKKPEN